MATKDQKTPELDELNKMDNLQQNLGVFSKEPNLNYDPRLDSLAYHVIDRSELPYQGKFYPKSWVFKFRSALGEEIRNFSMVDENSPLGVDDAIQNMLKACIMIVDGNGGKLSYKNINEFDRFYFLMKIRSVTFPEPENKIEYKQTCRSCGTTQDVNLDYFTLKFKDLDEKTLSYYNSEIGGFLVKTQSYGQLKIQPPNLYRAGLYRNWLIEQAQKTDKPDSIFGQIYWLLINDENTHDPKIMDTIYQKYLEIASNKKKLGHYVGFSEKFYCTAIDELKHTCINESCGAEVHTPIQFPNGIRGLFLITDIESELL